MRFHRTGRHDFTDTPREGAARCERENRTRNARTWRKARTKLASYPPSERAALRAHWQRCSYPGTGSYLLTMLHLFDSGSLQASALRGANA